MQGASNMGDRLRDSLCKRGVAACLLGAVILVTTFLLGVVPASAAFAWGGATAIDQPFSAKSISCPTSSFCLAGSGETSPAVYRSGAWSPGSGSPFGHVSCVSSTFCVGVGANDASVFNGTSWSAPAQVTPSTGLPYLDTVSCASESFCIAVDGSGNAYKYNGSTWTGAGNV